MGDAEVYLQEKSENKNELFTLYRSINELKENLIKVRDLYYSYDCLY